MLVLLEQHTRAQRERSQLGSKNGAGMEQLRAVAPQEAVKEQVEVLGVAMTSGKQRKATAKEPSRRQDAAYVNVTSRTGLLPIRRKDKHQTIRSVAMAKAAYGLLTRKPSAAETHKWDHQVWRSCGEPKPGMVHHKRLLLNVSLDSPDHADADKEGRNRPGAHAALLARRQKVSCDS